MSVLEKTAEPQVQSRAVACFHLHMAYASSTLLLIERFLGSPNLVETHNVSVPKQNLSPVRSFHVIWAILSAAALRGLRRFSIPVALFSTMIVTSTVTTGWHYVTDILGGVAIAGLFLFAASCYTRMNKFQKQLLRGVSL